MRTVAAVRAALVECATTACPDAQVFLGPRGTVTGPALVRIGDASGDVAPATMGPSRHMRERFDVEVTVSVTAPGTDEDQQAVTTEAVGLLAALDDALRAFPGMSLGLSGSGVEWAYVAGPWELEEPDPGDNRGARNCTLRARVTVSASYRL